MYVTEIEGGRETPTGSAISTVRPLANGRLELLYAQRDTSGHGALVTTLVGRTDLMPVEEIHDYGNGKIATLHYTASGVTTVRQHAGDTAQRAGPNMMSLGAYSSAVVDVVLRALPLTSGFGAELPVYFMGLGRSISVPVRVVGQEVITTRAGRRVDCWLVEADFPRPATEQFWIAKGSRQLIRVLGHAGPNTLQRYDR